MNNKEIFLTYLEAKEARAKAGFPNSASYAVEDTAYELDISIAEVSKAINEHS